jgi:hypothetical protein
MRSITRLFSAFGTLADSILSLASLIDTASAKLRLQLANETEPPALMHGDVIDAEEPAPAKRNTRASKASACQVPSESDAVARKCLRVALAGSEKSTLGVRRALG